MPGFGDNRKLRHPRYLTPAVQFWARQYQVRPDKHHKFGRSWHTRKDNRLAARLAKIAPYMAMAVDVRLDVGNADHGHLDPRHQASSHEDRGASSCGSASNARSSSRTSHTFRPLIRRARGIRPSVTSRSNNVDETPQYMAASSRESPRRGTGLICARGALTCIRAYFSALRTPSPQKRRHELCSR